MHCQDKKRRQGSCRQPFLFIQNAIAGILDKCGFREIFQDGIPGMTVSSYLQKKAVLPFFDKWPHAHEKRVKDQPRFHFTIVKRRSDYFITGIGTKVTVDYLIRRIWRVL